VLRVPLKPGVPLHPPEATQDVAFAEDHVSIADPPASIAVCDAFIDTVGCGMTGLEPPLHADSNSDARIKNGIFCRTMA